MKKINEIIIGTHNKGKFKEISDLLPKNIVKISPKNLNLLSPEETGSTFMQNSKIKAEYFAKKSNSICIADDSGLEIEILSGAPGIYSSRWAGSTGNFDIAIKRVYKELRTKGIKFDNKQNISARFISCLTICWPDGKFVFGIGTIQGKISENKKGNNGFGYDPIFIPIGYNKTFGEIEYNEKIRIDHRSQAFQKIKKFF